MRIIISGLTAAGKTTHAKIISDRLKLRYISASSILLEKYGVKTENQDYWVSDDSHKLNEQRLKSSEKDKEVDEKLIQLFDIYNTAVFDAWGLAWMALKHKSINIWLESDHESRIKKAIVSNRISGGRLEKKEIESKVNMKDQQSRKYFIETYGIDIYTDRSPYHLIIDISKFIIKADMSSSRKSIEVVDHILMCYLGSYKKENKVNSKNDEILFKQFGESTILKWEYPDNEG